MHCPQVAKNDPSKFKFKRMEKLSMLFLELKVCNFCFQVVIVQKTRNHSFCFSICSHFNLQSHSYVLVCYSELETHVTLCWKEPKSIPPSALNHDSLLEFISHQTSDSSTRSNKKLNPATHSWEVKPSLSSDSSGRERWTHRAKSNQARSQAGSDSYRHLF